MTITLNWSLQRLFVFIFFLNKSYFEMSLRQEIAELCQAIYLFQTNVSGLKQELFNIPIFTKKLMWNHMVGQRYHKATSNQLATFFNKHAAKISQRQMNLLTFNYSKCKDNMLTVSDLWQIFKPRTIKLTDEIISSREKRQVVAKCHQAHYKISDLLCRIGEKVIEFLILAEQMKKNIVSAQAETICIQPLDPQHLQIYINPFASNLLTKDVQLIFSHIMKNQVKCMKTFQEYFIPFDFKSGIFNPNYIRQDEQFDQTIGLQLTKHHWQNVHFINKQTCKKPLYLDQKSNLRKSMANSQKTLKL